MSHFGCDKWPTLDYRYECMFLILVCGTIVFQEQEEIRNRQRLVAGEVWSSRREEEGGRCKSKGILSQSFKAESFFQHIIQIAQKKHMFWHTCAEMIHVEVNTLNSHITPIGVRDTDPFLSGCWRWYTVIVEQRWVTEHCVHRKNCLFILMLILFMQVLGFCLLATRCVLQACMHLCVWVSDSNDIRYLFELLQSLELQIYYLHAFL